MKLRRLFSVALGFVLGGLVVQMVLARADSYRAIGVGGGPTNGACGFDEYPPCKIAEDACVLLTTHDVAAVLGGAWTRKGSGPMRPAPGAQLINVCAYDGPADDDDLELTVRDGGRAQFDHAVYNLGRGPTALSGVGDSAYELVSPGSPPGAPSPGSPAQVQLWVIKGGTYFEMMLVSDSINVPRWGAALARKVADRAK